MNSYIGYISLVLLVVLSKTASFENVHGGIFYNYKLVEGNVLLSLDNRGPRLCLRDCLMRTGCNAIYFDSVHLTCHLLKEAIVCYDKWDTNHIFTEKQSWSMVRKVKIYIYNSQNPLWYANRTEASTGCAHGSKYRYRTPYMVRCTRCNIM